MSVDGKRGALVHLQHELAVLLPADEPTPPGDGLVVGAAALDLEVQPLHHARRLRPVVGALLQLVEVRPRRRPDERAGQRVPQRVESLELARVRLGESSELRPQLGVGRGVLVQLGDADLAVVPAAEDEDVARRVVASVAERLPLDVAVRRVAPRVELDAYVARQARLEPQRVVADSRRIDLPAGDAPVAPVGPVRIAQGGAVEVVAEGHRGPHLGWTAQQCVQERQVHQREERHDRQQDARPAQRMVAQGER